MSSRKRSFDASDESQPHEKQPDASERPLKVAKSSMLPPTISASQMRKADGLSTNGRSNIHKSNAQRPPASPRQPQSMILTGGNIESETPTCKPKGPPPSRTHGDHLWFLDTAQRPPAPPHLEERFNLPKTSQHLKSFWETYLLWILGKSKFSMKWTKIDDHEYGVTIGLVRSHGKGGIYPIMRGLMCYPEHDGALKTTLKKAAMMAWPKLWDTNRTPPGRQCYFFLARDYLAFYIYSNIDGLFRPFQRLEDQRFCPINQYGEICEKLIHLLEAQMEWVCPTGNSRPHGINPHPYHFSGKVEAIPMCDNIKDDEEVPDKIAENEEVPKDTMDNEGVPVQSKGKERIRMITPASNSWNWDP